MRPAQDGLALCARLRVVPGAGCSGKPQISNGAPSRCHARHAALSWRDRARRKRPPARGGVQHASSAAGHLAMAIGPAPSAQRNVYLPPLPVLRRLILPRQRSHAAGHCPAGAWASLGNQHTLCYTVCPSDRTSLTAVHGALADAHQKTEPVP